MKKDVNYWFKEFRDLYPEAKSEDKTLLFDAFESAYKNHQGKDILKTVREYIAFLASNPHKKHTHPITFLTG